MANTKNYKNKTNKSGKSTSAKGGGKKKNTSDDTMKFLLVLVIAAIAIALIFFSQSKDNETGKLGTSTPAPTQRADITETLEPTVALPTEAPEQPETPTATPVPTATPIPTPALSAKEAEDIVTAKVDASVYNIQLVNSKLIVGNGVYYQFGAIKDMEFVSPFLAVNQADGSLHFYDSTEGTIFDFTKFPLKAEATPTPTPEPEVTDTFTAKQAYEILCTYSKEALHIAKEVKEYEAEYGDELTLIDGVDCYRINLSEFSNGKVRNRGEFYISVDGKKCYYIDNDTNEFVEAVK